MRNPYYLYDRYQEYAKAVIQFFSSEDGITQLRKRFTSDLEEVIMLLQAFSEHADKPEVVYAEAFHLENMFGHYGSDAQTDLQEESTLLMLKPYSFPAWIHRIREHCNGCLWVETAHMNQEDSERLNDQTDEELYKLASAELQLIREALAMRQQHTEYSIYCDDLIQEIEQAEADLLGWYKDFRSRNALMYIDDVIRAIDIYSKLIPDPRATLDVDQLPF